MATKIDGTGSAYYTGGQDTFAKVVNGSTQPIDASLWNKCMHAIVAVETKLCTGYSGSSILHQLCSPVELANSDFACAYPANRWSRLTLVSGTTTLAATATSATVVLTTTVASGYIAYPIDSRISVRSSVSNRYGVRAYYDGGEAVASGSNYIYTYYVTVCPESEPYGEGDYPNAAVLFAGTYNLTMLVNVVKVS